MKTLKILSLLFFVAFIVVSCGGDDDNNNNNVNCTSSTSIATAYQAEAEALAAATTAYTNDPTTANCNAYKNAYLDWLDAIRSLEDCYVEAGLVTEWEQLIDSTEAAINSLVC